MKLIELFFIIVKICEGKIYNDTDLISLGLSISKVLADPKGDPVNLERESYIYYAELEETYKYIKLNMSEGFETYANITEVGGPPHLKTKINYKKLLENDWREWEVSTLQDIYEDTADVWNRINLAICNAEIVESTGLSRVEERKLEKERRRKENDERVRLKLLKKEQRLRLQRRKLESQGLVPNFTVITAPPRGFLVTKKPKKRNKNHVRFGF